jgi:hypothetical protein
VDKTGKALLYKLKGASSAPLLAAAVIVDAPAKATQAVAIPLANWMF